MRLQGKVAVVTGASMGIGEAIAKRFCQEGASVVLASRDLARTEAARARIGSPERTLAVVCDVRERRQLDALAQQALSRFGRLDIWVNNAGHGLLDSVAAMDMAQCRAMFDTNLFGAVEGMQAAAAVMQPQGGGSIINISSVAGHIAVPYMAAYCATKHALNAMSKAARMELGGAGIHVMTVCPGYIRAEFSVNAMKGSEVRRMGENLRRGITAERVADAVLRGFLRRKRELVVPASNWLAIKAYQHMPQLVEALMFRSIAPTSAAAIAQAEAARMRTHNRK